MSNDSTKARVHGLSLSQRVLKRSFDIAAATIGLALSWWIIAAAYVLATVDTRSHGLFTQQRVGRRGKVFRIVKIRTMRPAPGRDTTVTTIDDPRITRLGGFFRRTKVDELPQLINILLGHMSFVGPRPDVPGFADRLQDGERDILDLRPGITGPATIRYRDEEKVLATHVDPERYNREVIFPTKVRMNIDYLRNYSFVGDMKYIWRTIVG